MIKSDDKLNTVIYRYGEDGQRALKFTQQSNNETLYFNNFYSVHQVAHEPNHEHGLRVSKHIFVGNSRLVTAMTHADNHGDTTEQTEKRYYYHADHLQSAQFITNAKGEQYEHIEYTPYGELWIEETAPGIDKLPFRFTGKELDEETGLYYYGARYLDPKYSRWLSGDPALNDYIPKAPIDDDAKKHNENLPGMGGVFNVVNLHVYHYAGNNPIKYTDPDGKESGLLTDSDSVPFAGHSAHYVEVYNDDGSSRGFELYEVGPTSEGETGVLSANPIDPTMIILGISASGSASGSSSSGPSGSTAGASSGAAAGSSSSGSSSSSGVGTAGVKVEFFKDKASLKKRLERYDRIKVLKTTKEQDIAIQKESQDRGRNFGKYNLFFNNCVQYSASCLKAGGIKTGTSFIPNRVHTYVEKNNK